MTVFLSRYKFGRVLPRAFANSICPSQQQRGSIWYHGGYGPVRLQFTELLVLQFLAEYNGAILVDRIAIECILLLKFMNHRVSTQIVKYVHYLHVINWNVNLHRKRKIINKID